MAKMHLCRCEVAIVGDIRNTVVKDGIDAVSFPEVQVLRAIHGAESVTNISVVGETDSDPAAEKIRLMAIYPPEVVDYVYPGYAPPLPMLMPGAEPAKARKTSAKQVVEQPADEADAAETQGEAAEDAII